MPLPVQSPGTASDVEENTGDLVRLTESFEAPRSTDNIYAISLEEGNALNPDYSSPDLPWSWGNESGLSRLGPTSERRSG